MFAERSTLSERSDTYLRDGAWHCVLAFSGWYAAASIFLRTRYESTLLQYWILLILRRHGTKSISDLQRMLGLNYTTVAECAASLENLGFLAKRQSEDDLRCSLADITSEGGEFFAELDRGMLKFSHDAWYGIPSSDKRKALALVGKACERMGKSRVTRGLTRGDSAFLVMCAQVTNDFKRACEELPLPANQAKLLLLLARHPEGIGAKDVARCLAERSCDVSRVFSKSEKRGLVVREVGPTKRERTIKLTEVGWQKARLVEDVATKVAEGSFGWIDDKQFFFGIMRSLAERLAGKP